MAKKKIETEMLVVASKCKKYLKEVRGLRCSAEALDVLGAKVRQLLNLAADAAEGEKRATVKYRDIQL